jgi:AcrR family transcriptional regulator
MNSTIARPTSDALLDAAEELWSRDGLGRVSLREIGRQAGQRNTRAVQYHFGNEDGLLDAVLARHNRVVDGRRSPMLTDLDANGGTLRDHAAALVRPLGQQLSTASGRRHLAISAELLNRGSGADVRRVGGAQPGEGSLTVWRRLVEPLLHPDAIRLHCRFNAVQFTHTELARQGRRSVRSTDHRVIVERTTDLAAALLGAPISRSTADALTR